MSIIPFPLKSGVVNSILIGVNCGLNATNEECVIAIGDNINIDSSYQLKIRIGDRIIEKQLTEEESKSLHQILTGAIYRPLLPSDIVDL